ncbi:hypothetical protein ACQQ6W_22945 [Lysinibacillus fusiformis]
MEKWIKFINREKTLLIDLLFILICILAMFYIFQTYTIKEIWVKIIDWNFNWKWSVKWYGLFAIYWIEVILVAFIWDLLWFRLNYTFDFFYTELTQFAVKRKRLWLLVKLIRIQYSFNKLTYYMRLGWISYYIDRRKELKDFIVSFTIFDFVKTMLLRMFKFPTIIAILLTLATNDMTKDTGLWILREHQAWIKGNSFLWEHFTKLSALVILVLILFLWYFVSSKGVIRRSIAQANRKKLEDVIQMHRQLTIHIIGLINTGSENLEYAFRCRESILDYWIYKRYPYTFEYYFPERCGVRDSTHFHFKDIPEISEIVTQFSNLLSEENRNISLWFSRYQYELIKVLSRVRIMKIKYYEEYLFTRNGFSGVFEPKRSEFDEQLDFVKEEIKEIQEHCEFFERYVLNSYIIEGMELLYEHYRYIHALNRLLHADSDKIGRVLRMFTGKE